METTAKKKRGRPKKEDPTEKLIELMSLQMKQQQQMMQQMLALADKNSEMVLGFFKMFTPPTNPNTSSSLEDRERGDVDEWEPIKMEDVAQLLGGDAMDFEKRNMN